MKAVFLFLTAAVSVFSQSRIYHKDGNSVEGKILEANSTHVTFQRAEDLQQFRFRIDELALNSQQLVDLYHSTERYSTIPKVQLPLDQKTLRSYVNYIDELITKDLRQKKLQPTRLVDDNTYIRRLYLVTIGRIPTQTELLDFLNNRDPNKKDKLIQKLLSSPGYVNHQSNWWSDMLRVKDRPAGTNINVGAVYRKWLRSALQENQWTAESNGSKR